MRREPHENRGGRAGRRPPAQSAIALVGAEKSAEAHNLSPKFANHEEYGEFPEIASMICRPVKLTCEGNKGRSSAL
jgi:hypothetical protein